MVGPSRWALGFLGLWLFPAWGWGHREEPLTVRVLASHQMDAVQVRANSASCDGRALAESSLQLAARDGQLQWDGSASTCRALQLSGPVEIRRGSLRRSYRGGVEVRVVEGRLAFFNRIALEEYLLGVVGAEQLPGSVQALRAQAVVSRTYALASRGRHRQAGYDLCDLAHCQLYRGQAAETPEVARAVASTRGEWLASPEGRAVPTYFHSSCGGATSSPSDVFGDAQGAAGVSDSDGRGPHCRGAPHFQWTWRVNKGELAGAVGSSRPDLPFAVTSRDAAGRALQLSAFGLRLRGEVFSSRVGARWGYTRLNSLRFEVFDRGRFLEFRGQGRGHGVGLCQHGALARGRAGQDYRRILAHYFPHLTLRK